MTNPPTPPYTEATVELVALALFEADRLPLTDPPWEKVAEFDRDSYRRVARLQLDALVKAGLLLPEGAETRTEWGVEVIPPDRRYQGYRVVAESEEVARGMVAGRDDWKLQSRRVSDWAYVDAVRLAEGDSSKGISNE